MRHSYQGWFHEQFGFLKRQFLQEGDLPFTSVLSEGTIKPALNAIDFAWKDRVDTPLVTLWIFLSQVISADHSCRGAVARLIAHRLANGQQPEPGEVDDRPRLPTNIRISVFPINRRAVTVLGTDLDARKNGAETRGARNQGRDRRNAATTGPAVR